MGSDDAMLVVVRSFVYLYYGLMESKTKDKGAKEGLGIHVVP